ARRRPPGTPGGDRLRRGPLAAAADAVGQPRPPDQPHARLPRRRRGTAAAAEERAGPGASRPRRPRRRGAPDRDRGRDGAGAARGAAAEVPPGGGGRLRYRATNPTPPPGVSADSVGRDSPPPVPSPLFSAPTRASAVVRARDGFPRRPDPL